ncbi:hypothetical protein KCP71_21590 [Salmonella enterica subsp. enterica]|nr:hypothetical protein KCP71_21590 [Salmonella enterica subsp. enterica]
MVESGLYSGAAIGPFRQPTINHSWQRMKVAIWTPRSARQVSDLGTLW